MSNSVKDDKSRWDSVKKRIYDLGILPVIAIEDADKAVPLAKALCEGGLPAAEITFRTACAKEAIVRIREALPDMLVGAGTVLTKEQVDDALDAGVEFIVTPGFNPEIVRYALSRGAVIMPGTATPGEMEQAMGMGLDVVKFFPAEQNGGIAKLKAVSAPYSKLSFIPTGGVNADNLISYIRFPRILACGGTWMVKKELIDAGNWEEIKRLTQQAVRRMLGFEFAHLGINGSGEEALKAANLISELFGFDFSDGSSSIFTMDNRIELLKASKPGRLGHIAIAVNSLERAVSYLRARGIELYDESAPIKGAAYLKEELLGFAVHLVQKK